MPAPASDPNRSLRFWHLVSACLIAVFVLLHIANHIAMLWGQDAHRAVMQVMRRFYRFPAFEIVLLSSIAFQLLSGVRMAWRRARSGTEGGVARAQVISGVVLAAFITNHVAAVLIGRYYLALDTDYRFAAAGMHAGLAWFFIPYYFAGVLALFVHIGCAIYWRVTPVAGRLTLLTMTLAGAMLGAALVAVMASDDDIPAAYLETYR